MALDAKRLRNRAMRVIRNEPRLDRLVEPDHHHLQWQHFELRVGRGPVHCRVVGGDMAREPPDLVVGQRSTSLP